MHNIISIYIIEILLIVIFIFVNFFFKKIVRILLGIKCKLFIFLKKIIVKHFFIIIIIIFYDSLILDSLIFILNNSLG